MSGDGQWARVPEWVAYKELHASALKVLIILAAKAGRERVAWMSHRTIAERLGIGRSTVSEAIRRLRKVGVIEEAGTVVVDRGQGTWVKRYRVVDRSPDLPVDGSGPSSAQVSDQAVVGPEAASGSGVTLPDVGLEGPDVGFGLPDVGPRPTHSVPQYSIPHRSVGRFENREDLTRTGSSGNAPWTDYPGGWRAFLKDQKRIEGERPKR